MKGKQPKQRMLAMLRQQASRSTQRLRLFRAGMRGKESSPRASRLSRSTSTFQSSLILQRRRPLNSSKGDGSKEAKTGKASDMRCFATTNQSGTIETGGTTITITTSHLCSERLITGTRATGSQPGVTLPTRIMHGMGLSTLIIACRQTR